MQAPSYYESVAHVYDTIVPRDIKGTCDSFEDILRRYGGGKQIVDLGCGTGRFAVELAKRKYSVCGIDLSKRMLGVARNNARRAHVRVKFLKADIRHFRLPQKARCIWARGSIGDLIQLPDLQKALLNVRRNLARNGLFVFDVRDYEQHLLMHKKLTVRDTRVSMKGKKKLTFRFTLKINRRSRIAMIDGEVLMEGMHSPDILKIHHAVKYFTRKELTRRLTAAGFKILELMPGYPLERDAKLRLLAVAQPRGQA